MPPVVDKARWREAVRALVRETAAAAREGLEELPKGMKISLLEISGNLVPRFKPDGTPLLDVIEPEATPIKVLIRYGEDETPFLEDLTGG